MTTSEYEVRPEVFGDGLEMVKTCTGCGAVRTLNHFKPQNDRPCGLSSQCRDCFKARLDAQAGKGGSLHGD